MSKEIMNATTAFTIDTVTDAQIEALLDESFAYGDFEMATICRRALDGHVNDRTKVCRVIFDARREADG